jgi:hypothetical protein
MARIDKSEPAEAGSPACPLLEWDHVAREVERKSSQSQAESGQAGSFQHLCICLLLYLNQNDFLRTLVTVSLLPSKSHRTTYGGRL